MNKLGLIFPGQGSQYIGMGKELYLNFPEAKAIFDQANDLLGFDLKKITVKHSSTAVDITPKGIDKVTGLAEFEKLKNVSRKNIIGIGDYMGDLPILNNVGMAAGPYNSSADVRAVLDYLSPYDTTAGVADILKQIRLVRATGAGKKHFKANKRK